VFDRRNVSVSVENQLNHFQTVFLVSDSNQTFHHVKRQEADFVKILIPQFLTPPPFQLILS
jgi:hypothetical protein